MKSPFLQSVLSHVSHASSRVFLPQDRAMSARSPCSPPLVPGRRRQPLVQLLALFRAHHRSLIFRCHSLWPALPTAPLTTTQTTTQQPARTPNNSVTPTTTNLCKHSSVALWPRILPQQPPPATALCQHVSNPSLCLTRSSFACSLPSITRATSTRRPTS